MSLSGSEAQSKSRMPSNSTVLITGATRGCGRALVDRFIERGWTVLGCGRGTDNVSALSDTYRSPHQFHVVDVADDAAVAGWIRELSTNGAEPPRLVLNVAAVMNDPAPLWKISAEEFNRLMAVNVSGTANVVRHVVPWLLPAGRGVIVNFSSGWGRSTSPDVAPYCASKFAVEGLSRSVSMELPAGFACVALNPGIINTEMLRQCWADGAAQYPSPDEWSRRAVERLERLDARDNGRSLDV